MFDTDTFNLARSHKKRVIWKAAEEMKIRLCRASKNLILLVGCAKAKAKAELIQWKSEFDTRLWRETREFHFRE